MARKGNRKYTCEECKAESFHHWTAANRAAGIRCPACGSKRMSLVSEAAKKDAADLQAVRVAGGTRSTTTPRIDQHKKVM